VVPNGRSQVLKLASSGGYMTPRLHVCIARLPVEITQRFVTKIIENAVEARCGFLWPRVLRDYILGVDCDYVSDLDGSGVTIADAGHGFFVEVVPQGSFSFFSLARACPSAALDLVVSDDPDSLLDDPSIGASSCRL
jgi:hypothetical protein